MAKTLKQRYDEIMSDVYAGRKTAIQGADEYMKWVRRDRSNKGRKKL